MPESDGRMFHKRLHWLMLPVEVLGFYLAVATDHVVLGVALIAIGMLLTFSFALARKPA